MPAPVIAAGVTIGGQLLRDRLTPKQGVQQSAGQASGLSDLVGTYMRRQYSMAEPAYSKALTYYSALMGSRGRMQQALAPTLQAQGQAFTGAQRGLERSSLRGGQREQASADLKREHYGATAATLRDAPAGAAGKLAELGQMGFGNALSAAQTAQGGYLGAGGLYGSLLQSDLYGKQMNQQLWGQAGEGIAKILLPWLLEKYGKKGGAA